jgi:lipopolysaccharide transport system permease protein
VSTPSTSATELKADCVVYDSDPQLSHPVRFFGNMGSDLGRSWWLTGQLLRQNLRARYRFSILGYLWLFAVPLSIAAVWIFLHRSGIISLGPTSAPYPAYVIAGLFLWTGFLRMLNSPIQQLNASRHFLAKISFPWETIVLAAWAEALLEFAVFLMVLIGVLRVSGLHAIVPILSSIPVVLGLFALGGALGLLLSPLGLLYEDVQRAIGVITYGLFFLTPIVYPPPTTFPAVLTVKLNPVAVLLVTSREIMTSVPVSHPQWALTVSFGVLVLLMLAWVVFRLAIPHLISKL